MLQDIYNSIQDKIQQQIQEKFGLSADQTTQSTNVLLENFKKFFSEDLMAGGMTGLRLAVCVVIGLAGHLTYQPT